MVKPYQHLFQTNKEAADFSSTADSTSPKAAEATVYAAVSQKHIEDPAFDQCDDGEVTPKKHHDDLQVLKTVTKNAPIDDDADDAKPAPARSDAEWNAMLFSLLLFKARWGDLNIPPNDSDHTALYDWVQEQRALYKVYQEKNGGAPEDDEAEPSPQAQGGLTPDRISVLDTIGFTWNIRGDVFWQKHYNSLVAYKKENGDAKVPRLYSKNPKLGEWVTDQRRQLKAKLDGRPSMMTDERKEKLDAVGFVWKVRERADWNDRYEQLLEFKKENGHCVVPQHYAQNRALGKWVAKQREQYRFYHAGQHSFLTEERIDLLKSLGFVWRVKGKSREELEEMPSGDGKGDDDEEEEEEEAPKKKKKRKMLVERKLPMSKNTAKADSNDDEEDDDAGAQLKPGSPDSPRQDIQVGTADVVDVDLEDRKAPAIPPMPHPTTKDLPTRDPIPSTGAMNGMGLLASVTDQMPGVPTSARPPSAGLLAGAGTPGNLTLPGHATDPFAPLPSLTDQCLFAHAQQQHAARASMAATLAAHANQHQMEIAQQAVTFNTQTMADIAAALARQSRFGSGFGAAPGMSSGMSMFNMSSAPRGMSEGSGDPDESLRNAYRL